MGPVDCSETSKITTTLRHITSQKNEDPVYNVAEA